MHKYLLKAFYNRTNKKKYKSQILEYIIYYTNIIVMQDTILVANVPVENVEKKKLVVNMPDIEVTWICSITHILLKYNWHLDLIDDETAIDLGL